MAYKKMDDATYIVLTLFLHFIIMLSSIFVNDMSVIIDIIGAISATSLIFLIPAFFYLYSASMAKSIAFRGCKAEILNF